MECKDARELMPRYIDDELTPEAKQATVTHINGCPDCRRLADEELAWHRSVRQAGTRYQAPEAVKRQVLRAIRSSTASRLGGTRAWAMAASVLLAVVLSSGGTVYLSDTVWVKPAREEAMVGEMVDSHVRSLLASHLTDVASSDQHTVKPWFHGRLDYAPPVSDPTAEGFPLIGGRLDYIDHRSVAALVYRHDKHPINLFVFPTPEADGVNKAETRNGYNILHWTQQGFAFWAVSDLNAAELRDFATVLQHQS
jgi:anti-sigma factor RsiW